MHLGPCSSPRCGGSPIALDDLEHSDDVSCRTIHSLFFLLAPLPPPPHPSRGTLPRVLQHYRHDSLGQSNLLALLFYLYMVTQAGQRPSNLLVCTVVCLYSHIRFVGGRRCTRDYGHLIISRPALGSQEFGAQHPVDGVQAGSEMFLKILIIL